MKDDRFVVRINGLYFPWDAAAPIVYGMVSFGGAQILEPKGMMAVNQVEKTVTGDPSKESISPSGNWRLWPFSFRRSRSRKAMQSVLSDVTTSDIVNASEIKMGVIEAKNMLETKAVKKMVRVLCPTSEQLASLNLKEGRNTVTFTFLTPMLGKQQVFYFLFFIFVIFWSSLLPNFSYLKSPLHFVLFVYFLRPSTCT